MYPLMSLKTVRDAAFDQFHELLKSAPLHDVTVIPIDANVTVPQSTNCVCHSGPSYQG